MANVTEISNSDWQGFAGAEGWVAGLGKAALRPVVRQIGKWFLLADKNGVGAYIEKDNHDLENWALFCVFPSQRSAIAFLEDLPEDFEPGHFSFEKME